METNLKQREQARVMTRQPVSGFVICFNEEDQIEACLKSISFCDEIIVVDSYSTDRTVELAERFGAKVVQRAWSGYRDQKAFGLSLCTHEWVINLDADERVSPELRENILAALAQPGAGTSGGKETCGYYINRVVFYLGRWWRTGGWYPEYRLRFFRKSRVTWGGVEPHEKPIVDGATESLGGELEHYTYKNMDEQLSRLHAFSTIAAREEYQLGRRATWKSLLFNPILRMLKFYVLKRGFREGMAGFIVAAFEGYYTLMKYAKLWEHEFEEKRRARGNKEAAG